MSFDFGIDADATGALKAANATESALDGVEKQAKKVGSAIDGAFQDGGGKWHAANGRFLTTNELAQRTGQSVKGAGDAMASAGDSASQAAVSIGDMVEAAAAFISLHFAEVLLDGYTEIHNRLVLVAKDQDNLNGLMEGTYQVAQQTRTAWGETAETYQRLSNATRGLGRSQQDTLDLTKELAQGIKISGSTSQQASAALADFAHVFQVGSLTGREFKVEMKDANALMNILREQSGLTGSQFAEMGKKGQITAATLIDWFGKAGPEIQAKFGLIIPTIADDVTTLKNAAEKFFGSAGEGAGIMDALGRAAAWVGENFDTIGKVVLGVVEALGGLFVIEKIISLTKALTAAIAANPLGALVIALTAGIMLIRQFGDELNSGIAIVDDAGGAFATIGDVLRATWEVIKEIGAAIVDFLDGAWKSLKDAFSEGLDGSGIKATLGDVLRFIATFVATAIEMFKHFKDVAVTLFVDIPIELANAFIASYPAIKQVLETIINGVFHALNGIKAIANEQAVSILDNNIKDMMERRSDVFQSDMKDTSSSGAEKARKDYAAATAAIQIFIQKRDELSGKVVGFDLEIDTKKLSEMAAAARDHRVNTVKGIQKDVEDDVAYWEGLIQKFAAMRSSENAKGPGRVGTDKGAAEAAALDEKAAKAREKLNQEYLEIVGASNPIAEAQYKIARAEDIVDKAVRAHLATQAEGAQVMDNYRTKLQDQLFPMEAWIRKTQEAIDASGKLKEAREHEAEVTKVTEDLTKKGLTLTDQQRAVIDMLVLSQEKQREQGAAEQAQFDAIRGPYKEYLAGVSALMQLRHDQVITDREYTDQLGKIRDAYVATTPEAKTFETGMRDGLKAIKAEATDVASVLKTVLMDAFHDVEQAITDLVVKGKVDWSSMVQSMLTDMTKLLERQAEAAIINRITGTGTGTGASIIAATATGAAAMGSAILTAGIAAAGAMAAAITGAAALSSLTGTVSGLSGGMGATGAVTQGAETLKGLGSILGFATGGSFTVGGGGGTDSQVVAFRATPGESVSINRPGDQPSNTKRGDRTKVVNRFSPNDGYAAIDSPLGERLVLNIIDRNNPRTRKGRVSKT